MFSFDLDYLFNQVSIWIFELVSIPASYLNKSLAFMLGLK